MYTLMLGINDPPQEAAVTSVSKPSAVPKPALTQPTGQTFYLLSLLLDSNIVEAHCVLGDVLGSVKETKGDRPSSLKMLKSHKM